jgi:hypothetical protein
MYGMDFGDLLQRVYQLDRINHLKILVYNQFYTIKSGLNRKLADFSQRKSEQGSC